MPTPADPLPDSPAATAASGPCPVCSAPSLTPLFRARDVPVHVGLQWPTEAAARSCPRGDIDLAACNDCGFITNIAFDPELMAYEGSYENSLHFSPLFQEYAKELAGHLIATYELNDKDIVEIGCGNGDFLALLVEEGGNRGLGFDPSAPETSPSSALRFVRDEYGIEQAGEPVDLICCRQALEHFPKPMEFLDTIRRTLGGRTETALFFEVPDFSFALRTMAVWDIVYEHCSNFGPGSLHRAFTESGFDVLALRSYFGDTFLGIEAKPHLPGRPAIDPPGDADRVAAEISSFTDRWPVKLGEWQERLNHIARSNRSAVLWGAGARAVTFCNLLDARPPIDHIVDLNPRKHGLYLAGGGQQIVAPEFLIDHPPDLVILTNGMYRDEIAAALEEMGVSAELAVA